MGTNRGTWLFAFPRGSKLFRAVTTRFETSNSRLLRHARHNAELITPRLGRCPGASPPSTPRRDGSSPESAVGSGRRARRAVRRRASGRGVGCLGGFSFRDRQESRARIAPRAEGSSAGGARRCRARDAREVRGEGVELREDHRAIAARGGGDGRLVIRGARRHVPKLDQIQAGLAEPRREAQIRDGDAARGDGTSQSRAGGAPIEAGAGAG